MPPSWSWNARAPCRGARRVELRWVRIAMRERCSVGAVATGGVGYSQQQLLRISKFAKRAICFDSTPEGQSQAKKLCSDLSVFSGETYNIVWSSGKDASRADEGEREKLRRLLR